MVESRKITYGPLEPEVQPGETRVVQVIRGNSRKLVHKGNDQQQVDEAIIVSAPDGQLHGIYAGVGTAITIYEASLIADTETANEAKKALKRGRAEKRKKREAIKKKTGK